MAAVPPLEMSFEKDSPDGLVGIFRSAGMCGEGERKIQYATMTPEPMRKSTSIAAPRRENAVPDRETITAPF